MKKLALLAALSFSLVLLTGCGQKPEEVVNEYLQLIMVGKIHEATYLCTGDAFKVTKAVEGAPAAGKGFNYLIVTSWPEIEPTLKYSVASTAPYKADVTVNSNGTEVAVYSLIKENDKWKISEAPPPNVAWTKIMDAIHQ